jgi:hypothetical protein
MHERETFWRDLYLPEERPFLAVETNGARDQHNCRDQPKVVTRTAAAPLLFMSLSPQNRALAGISTFNPLHCRSDTGQVVKRKVQARF